MISSEGEEAGEEKTKEMYSSQVHSVFYSQTTAVISLRRSIFFSNVKDRLKAHQTVSPMAARRL